MPEIDSEFSSGDLITFREERRHKKKCRNGKNSCCGKDTCDCGNKEGN
ncbi:MAG: hypothetical protein WC472_00605 [Candidatus Paceibacterota bacterium]